MVVGVVTGCGSLSWKTLSSSSQRMGKSVLLLFEKERSVSDPSVALIERRPEAVVLHILADRPNESNLTALRSEVTAAAAESPELPVILDMTKVAFMPSLSLGAMVQLSRQFQVRKQRLMLAGLQQFVRETMTITRLDRLFEIHDDVPAALKAVRGGA